MLITAVALVHLLVLRVHQTLLAPLVILVFMVLLAKINVALAVPDVLAALPAPHCIADKSIQEGGSDEEAEQPWLTIRVENRTGGNKDPRLHALGAGGVERDERHRHQQDERPRRE